MPVIKRYSNRKLYDTRERRYVTLEDIAVMIQNGENIEVVDHASGADLTTVTLAQVIFELEKRLGSALPEKVFHRLIQAGGDTLEGLRYTVQALLEPAQHVEEEIQRRLGILYNEGKVNFEEKERLSALLLDERLRLPPKPIHPDEIQALNDQVNQLEKELIDLKENRK
jgi:polyhydroxyalkanoate synthesis repressor PhaR